MRIPLLSYQLPFHMYTPDFFERMSRIYPRMKYSFTLDGITKPKASLLQALCVGHAKVAAARPDKEGPDFKIVLKGKALRDFLIKGESSHLNWVLTFTPGQVWEAVQLDYPETKLPVDLNLFYKAVKALECPTIMRMNAGAIDLFNLSMDYDDLMTIPLMPVERSKNGITYARPYDNRPTGYQFDLSKWSPRDFEAALDVFSRQTPAKSELWFDWFDSKDVKEQEEFEFKLGIYYTLASKYFDFTKATTH